MKTLNIIKWKDDQGDEQKFCLVSEVSARWKDFGMHLKITQNDLDAMEEEHGRKAKACWKDVMNQWLDGKGEPEYPSTWEGMYTLLDDLELSEVAKRLKKAVNNPLS